MRSRVQTLRSSITRQRPADLDPGILYTNFADQQIGVMDAAGDPMDLVAVRFFRTTAEYIVGEMVHHNGNIYKCLTPTGPGAFTAAHWVSISEPTEAPIDGSIYGRSSSAWVQTVTKATYDANKAATDASIANLGVVKAPLASPAFTGNPTAPTAAPGDNDSTLATTAFVTAAVAAALTGGVSLDLDDLGDVNAGSPTDGQVLAWDDGAATWLPVTPATGGATTLDGLTDVNAPAPTVGQVLTWDDTPGEWVAATPAAVPADLDDLADVNAAAPSNGQVLTWDSTPGEWVAATPAVVPEQLNDLTDVNALAPSDGEVLTWDSGTAKWIAAVGGGVGGGGSAVSSQWSIIVAVSDETTDLTTGDSKITFYMDRDVTLTEVFSGLSGQSSSGNVTIDVRKNSTTIFSTPPSIQANEDTSLTGTVAALSDTTFNKGDKVEIDIDAAGTGASGLKVVFLGDIPVDTSIGKHTIWVPASAMLSATTSGAAVGQIETTTNKINVAVLDFDDAADEYAHFHVAFPKSWDKGTVSFQAFWTTTATGTTGVAWALEGIAVSDNEAADAAWGTAVVVTDDAQGATTEILVTAESAAVTIGGTPANSDVCFFRVTRDVSDANDDMTEDARLIGIKLFYTIDTETDD